MGAKASRRGRVWLPVAGLCLGLFAAGWALTGSPRGTDPAGRPDPEYVRWLERQSMLYQAREQARGVSGSGVQWRHPYGEPRPRAVVRQASVWVLDYPGSVIPRRGRSVIATWADPELWDAFRAVGIDLLHTGPVKRAGGVRGRRYTPTLDGWFDRVSLEVDPQLGTEEEYRRMVQIASRRGGLIAGDLVPLHTGTGPDFRLALMGYKDYPGMYAMVEVRREDWHLLPEVDGPWAGVRVPREAAEELTRKGYIPGLISSKDAARDARAWSGWSASGEVTGVDGRVRRWVYLHYFKPTQPTLNWLDPSFAAQRAVSGDVVKTVHTLGARVVRLDAVPFLGIEPRVEKTETWHYQHPLSVTATDTLAYEIRKLGGWSFHELNVPLESLKRFTEHGPDLSYDFFTRAQVMHALLTGDAGPLRQAYGFLLGANVPPVTLVHDLQNHDEITYQLVELDHRKDEAFVVNGKKVTGKQLREEMLREMRARAAGPAAPHNRLYRPGQDGVATTFAAFVAAAVGVRDPYHATAEEVKRIREGHLLLALANAMQPGVFSLSSWDLVGALPISEDEVRERTADGDYRWINRGGVDLMGKNPQAGRSAVGLPRAKALYGPLPGQLKDPDSFASRLRVLLAARKEYRLAEGELLAAPDGVPAGVWVLVMKPPGHALAVTAVNFGRGEAEVEVDLGKVKGVKAAELAGAGLTDVVAGKRAGQVGAGAVLKLRLPALSGQVLVVGGAAR